MILKEMSTQADLKTQELTANYYENYVNTYTSCKSALAYIHCYVSHNRQLHSSKPNFLCYLPQKRKFRLRFLSFLDQTSLKNRVTMATV